MEDIFKNFDENLDKMLSVLDERKIADSNLDREFKNFKSGRENPYAMLNKFDQDEIRRIEKPNINTFKKKNTNQ